MSPNTQKPSFPTIACFGEILWDVLPTGKQPGGAPFNVAVHLHQLGLPVRFISRVGEDELGTELVGFVTSKGVATDLIQHDQAHRTGVVNANVDDASEVTYDIVQPMAWDYIEPSAAVEAAVATADAFVFGSLGARQAGTRETLYRLLECAKLKVFDVNMRPPHYTRTVVEHLLGQADMVKMNHHELAEIMGWFGADAELAAAMPWLVQRFGLQAVCVTCGADGALLWMDNQLCRAPGIAVHVQDTIGSGDSFLAALLKDWLTGRPPQEALNFACATGALVAARQGATPTFVEADVRALMQAAEGR
ncbi:carbohydrate kinase [Hymenobacter sp. BT523]|uniref:carbohydrate kinase family protein n=1 Tax=Hymenobacter sp. BT523 TaxID=2795725 RepID=UPI0018ECB801|nr:carbohydrate kinase [Hymenobacter sp. BT523]MBJ6111671.1 carbohydrate kinase [Hymenobacter sp. BT523]